MTSERLWEAVPVAISKRPHPTPRSQSVTSHRSKVLQSDLLTRLDEMNPNRDVKILGRDFERILGHWIHTAILESTYLTPAPQSGVELASRFGVDLITVERALARLKRVGLILETPSGFKKTEESILLQDDKKNSSLQNYHQQGLELAGAALKNQTPQERWTGTETIPFDPALMPAIDEAAEKFLTELKEISRRGNRTEVYHAAVHFFRMEGPPIENQNFAPPHKNSNEENQNEK